MNENKRILSAMYDQYSPIVYDIASQNCNTPAEAEQITLLTFQRIEKQGLANLDAQRLGAMLIKLTVLTINEHLHKKDVVVAQLKNKPLLNKILCAGSKIKDISSKSELTTAQIRKMIREEFNAIRNAEKIQDEALSFT